MLTNSYDGNDGNIWARGIVLLVKRLLYKQKNLSHTYTPTSQNRILIAGTCDPSAGEAETGRILNPGSSWSLGLAYSVNPQSSERFVSKNKVKSNR